MARMKLPPGFRFHPTDVELVTYYLKRKIHGRAIEFDIVAEVDIYKCEPWDLPEKSLIGSSDPEWYFFSARDKKYANGSRTNRATEAGYWKATGKDRAVKTGSQTVGMKKTLVFYKGRAPHGGRTDWVMHEYRLGDDDSVREKFQDAFVLCRVFKKNGIGPNHPENSTSFDFEEETAVTTTEDVLVPDDKPFMSELEAGSVSLDVSTKNYSIPSEMKDNRTVLKENSISGATSSTFVTPEESDDDMSLFFDSLLNDPNQYLGNFTTIKRSTSEHESLETVLGTELPASPITAQDFALWLEAPASLGELNASAALSGNQLSGLFEDHSFEEADMLDELYRSTLQSQEFKMATQHVGARASNSKCAMQARALSKTVSEDMNDISEVHNDVLKDEVSSLSDQTLFEGVQTFSSKSVSGLEDIPEEVMLEELLQLIDQSKGGGQPSQVEGTEFQGEGATSSVEDDVFFDISQDPNTEEWMQTDLQNESSRIHDRNNESLEPTSSQLEDWLSETLASSSDLPFSETLPELLGSGLLHSSSEEQGQTNFQYGTKLSPLLEDSTTTTTTTTTTTKVHMYSLQNSNSKPSKPLSRFSKLLESVPVLPASAAEFPPDVDKLNFASKDNLLGNSASQSSMQTTYWNACFRAITIRCGCEFLSGVSKLPTPRLKQQILISEDKSVLSLNSPIDNVSLSEDSVKGCSFRRNGNGCYSLGFFLGALSAVLWFLLLRLAWRFASRMGSLLT